MAFFKKKKETISKKQVNDISKLVTPQYGGSRILKKSYVIGNFSFTVGINRITALDGLQHTPKYFEIIQSDLAQTVNSPNFDYFEFIKENPEQKLTEFLKMQEETLICSEEIVRYLLPKMLELGKTNIDGYKSYNDYANKLLQYCEDNDILYDWQEDYEEELDDNISTDEALDYVTSNYHKGLINKLMEVVQLGFTQGSSPSKPKIKITEM